MKVRRERGTVGAKGVRIESADVQGAQGRRGGLGREEKEGGGAAQERQGQQTSENTAERAGQRAAYSYQRFKHIPPRRDRDETIRAHRDSSARDLQNKSTFRETNRYFWSPKLWNEIGNN